MAQSSWLREQEERAFRLARESTDATLKMQLERAGTEFRARAEAQEKLDAPQ
jgi:hypothetical protein